MAEMSLVDLLKGYSITYHPNGMGFLGMYEDGFY